MYVLYEVFLVTVAGWGFVGGEGAVFLPDPSVTNLIGLGVFLKMLNSVTKVGGSMKYSVKNKNMFATKYSTLQTHSIGQMVVYSENYRSITKIAKRFKISRSTYYNYAQQAAKIYSKLH